MSAPRQRIGRFVLGALVVAGIAALGFALASRSGFWERVLKAFPGNVSASMAVARAHEAAHERVAALETVAACAAIHPQACACAEEAASLAIDAGRYRAARHFLDVSDSCARSPRRVAISAEGYLGTGALDDGEREAERALERDPNDAHAVYARAWAVTLRGRPLDARADAERAVALGRGVPAELLLGTILFAVPDLDGADALFQRALSEDATCAQAVYDHALVADREHRYHDAREGYLRALSLDPKNADARFNLVVLTHANGATLEARHHLQAFEATFPGDARIEALKGVLSVAPGVKAMTL